MIDTHAHVNFNAFKDDADEVIKRSLSQGVSLINVGSQYSTSARALKMAHKYETGVWAAIGIHPIQLKARKIILEDRSELESGEILTTGEKFDFEKYKKLADDPGVVAIGEVGLDYHHFEAGDDEAELKKQQADTLVQFIDLANEVNKPVILHCWDAYSELLEILKNHPVKKLGVIHSFIGGYKTAKKFIELGYEIGLNGIITFSDSCDKLIKETDIKNIVIETDCPYLAPVPMRGKRNEPAFVKFVVEKIAQTKEISLEEAEKTTTENAKNLFKI